MHKQDCNGPLTDRSQYLIKINRAFQEHFENLAQFKEEGNFKRCLSKLTLQDVRDAVRRAKAIMQKNKTDGKHEISYKGFRYYPDNPALTVWQPVENILTACKLLG